MAEFKTWRGFRNFEREVRLKRRFIRSLESDEFLRQILETCDHRIRSIEKGVRLYRAQIGNAWRTIPNTKDEEAIPLPPERMKPEKNRAFEGRINPKGMPCLYLSTTADAAASEIRPWIGSTITLAEFIIAKPLRIVDCSVKHTAGFLYYREEPPAEDRARAVWTHIDKAFAAPVTRSDDVGDYVATQILAEAFRTNGYDGISYKSPFGEDAYTMALFDMKAAKCDFRYLRRVTAATFFFEDEPPQ
jgi:hypothetical protein